MNLFEPLVLELLETETYISDEHKKTFFEMIFVLEGSGQQVINGYRLPYKSNKLFLVFPHDSHHFEVIESSVFFLSGSPVNTWLTREATGLKK